MRHVCARDGAAWVQYKGDCVKKRAWRQRAHVVMSFAAIVVVGCVAAVEVAHAEPSTLYRETFTFCTDTVGKDAAEQTRWYGVVQGLPKEKVSNLKVFAYGSSDIGGSVNSTPIGLSQGYTFWFRPVYGLSVLTNEFPFDAALLKTTEAVVEYKQRLSGVDLSLAPNKTQLLFLIDNNWYISQEAVSQVRIGIWEQVSVNPATLTYGVVPLVAGVGPLTPTEYNAPLPAAGTVRAFGVFLAEVNGRVRIDNFVIKSTVPPGSSISTAVQEPNYNLCPEGSPDRTGSGGGQTPPNEDDGDTTPDQGVPDPVVPVAQPTPSYIFCPIKQQGTGRAVVVSRKARGAILRKITGSSLLDLRDRAIIAILAQRPLPLGALVNVKVGDYNTQTGVLSVSKRASAKPLKVKLRGAALSALTDYLRVSGAPSAATAPLFVSASAQGIASPITGAACFGEIRTMARIRAKKAQIVLAGVSKPKGR